MADAEPVIWYRCTAAPYPTSVSQRLTPHAFAPATRKSPAYRATHRILAFDGDGAARDCSTVLVRAHAGSTGSAGRVYATGVPRLLRSLQAKPHGTLVHLQ